MQLQPFFKMSNLSGCALKCELYEDGITPPGYTSPTIKSFDATNGWIVIATDDITLHGTSMTLTVRCGDPRSESDKQFAQTSATISFRNPCYDTVIFQEDLQQTVFNANLWEPIFYNLPPAFSSEDCGPISYFLTGLTQPEPFELTTNNGSLGFWIRATEPEQAKIWNWALNACIIIDGNDQVCKTQDGLIVDITNTCTSTQIIQEPVTGYYQVMQGSTNTDFAFDVWSWPDTVGYTNAGTYGNARCGTKSYEIRDSFGNIVDWVTVMADGTLKINPGVDIEPRVHTLSLTVFLDDYTQPNGQPIYSTVSFAVDVKLCTPVIDTSVSVVSDIFYHRWASTQPSLRNFFPFQYDAPCQLEFSYSAKIILESGSYADLPYPEILFYPDENQIVVSKCDPNVASTANDAECMSGIDPYFKYYEVEITGTLNDYNSSSDTTSFKVTIGPNCDVDTVTYGMDVSTQFDGNYVLGINQAYPLNLTPMMSQEVTNCPVTCELTSLNSFDPISYFNDLNGDLTISTQSPTLNGKTFQYSIECISEYSYTQVLPAVQTFSVSFAFEACNSVINHHSVSVSEQTIYWFQNKVQT